MMADPSPVLVDPADPAVAARWTQICRAAAIDIVRISARLTDRIERLDRLSNRPGASDADLAEDARQIVLLASDIATSAGVIQRRGDYLAGRTSPRRIQPCETPPCPASPLPTLQETP